MKLFQDQVNYKSLRKAKLKLLYFAFLDISLLVPGTPTLCSSLLVPGTTPLSSSLLVPGTTGLLRFFRHLPPYLFQEQLPFPLFTCSRNNFSLLLLTCSRNNLPLLLLTCSRNNSS